jgi:DNA-binding response OmpR family regulator
MPPDDPRPAPPAPGSGTILVVDDEFSIRQALRVALEHAGHRVVEAADGELALAQIATAQPRLILLDIDMPRRDGWSTLAELRRRGFTQPVLLLTCLGDQDSRIRGLDTGADDYLGKPFGVPELLARVRALLRRTAPPAVRLGATTVDLAGMSAVRAGHPVRLSRTDFALLALLHAHAGQPVPRQLILERIWQAAAGSSHALDTHIYRLRRKLGDDSAAPRWLCSVAGVGYALRADPPA